MSILYCNRMFLSLSLLMICLSIPRFIVFNGLFAVVVSTYRAATPMTIKSRIETIGVFFAVWLFLCMCCLLLCFPNVPLKGTIK